MAVLLCPQLRISKAHGKVLNAVLCLVLLSPHTAQLALQLELLLVRLPRDALHLLVHPANGGNGIFFLIHRSLQVFAVLLGPQLRVAHACRQVFNPGLRLVLLCPHIPQLPHQLELLSVCLLCNGIHARLHRRHRQHRLLLCRLRGLQVLAVLLGPELSIPHASADVVEASFSIGGPRQYLPQVPLQAEALSPSLILAALHVLLELADGLLQLLLRATGRLDLMAVLLSP
mmetsp:Transcript_43046/g.102186  ORF Transcript_43046/g.102186 Transcript_43046/m.102186 type:complete len:230 (-) Transcript_43046:442-1131(-)